MDMTDITKAGSLMVKPAKDGTETWIYPITSTDNVMHHDTEQLDEYLDAMEKSIVTTDATQTQHGLLSASDKKKLDGIASGANKTTVDTALSTTSTNPVQNKVVKTALDGKSDTSHTHTKSDIGLGNVDNKSSETIRGEITSDNIISALTYTPAKNVNMTAATDSAAGKAGLVPAPAAGKQASFLRGDGTWVVPTNTTYNDVTQSAHGLMTAADKTKLDGIASGANKTTVDSEMSSTSTNPVQNKIVQAALDKKSDTTHTHTKSDIGLGNVENKSSATIRGELTKENVTTALGYTPPTTNTTYSDMKAATSNAAGTHGLVPAPAAGKQASFLRGDGTWVVPTNTTYDDATQSAHGLMTAADKTKLDGIASGANKTTVDTAMSSTSTNPVQNKIVQAALDKKSDTTHTHTKSDIGLGNVENKSSATIRGELTKENVTTALGYTPPTTDTTYSDMKGATSNATGTHGLVPAPAAGKQASFLRGDGTWVVPTNTTYSDMTAATASAAGTHGLVPAPAAGSQTKFLRGDGTWQTPTNTTYDDLKGATSSAAGAHGLVPAPAAGKQNSFLRGDGAWVVPTDTTYDDATQSAHGLMTAADKKKLDGIASGATAVVVDATLSTTSTNAIQNKAVQAAITAVSDKVDNIIKDAPEAYDTFKEISDYIASHTTEYEALLAISNNKVDKVDGKGLSTNDFTTALKTKLDGIASGATNVTVDSGMSSTSTNPVQNKVVYSQLSARALIKLLTSESLNDVKTPGFYNAGGGNIVTNKPSGVDNFGLIVVHIASGDYYVQIIFYSGKSWRRYCSNGTWADWTDDKLTDTTYNDVTTSTHGLMTAADKTKLDGIATGANKTTVDSAMSSTSTNPVQNKIVQAALDKKSDTDHTHTKSDIGLGNVENKSSATIRGELTSTNVTTALGFTPAKNANMTAASASSAGTAGLVPAPAAGKQASFLRGDGTWVVPTNTTYNDVTQSVHGLMTAADKTKLDGIASGANKTTVDSDMSSTSTNPVQNKVIQAALNNKVTVVSGKGLSTNDFTAAYKTKLDSLTALDLVTELPSSVTADASYLLIDDVETVATA